MFLTMLWNWNGARSADRRRPLPPTPPTTVDKATQTDDADPPLANPPLAPTLFFAPRGERFHVDRCCQGLRTAKSVVARTACLICG